MIERVESSDELSGQDGTTNEGPGGSEEEHLGEDQVTSLVNEILERFSWPLKPKGAYLYQGAARSVPRILEEVTVEQRTPFMELSALLTGIYSIVVDPTDRALSESTADEYWQRLVAAFPDRLPKLLDAYQRVAPGPLTPEIGNTVLEQLRAEPEFTAHGFVAKQIVNIWYFSQFTALENDKNAPLLDGGFFERGYVWPIIKAHPIGFSDQPHGYWTQEPRPAH